MHIVPLKPSCVKRINRFVIRADEEIDGSIRINHCKVWEIEDTKETEILCSAYMGDDDIFWFASAGACTLALSQAAEEVTSGESDVMSLMLQYS